MSLFDPHLTAEFTVRVRGHRFTEKEIQAIADRLARAAMGERKHGSEMVWDATETHSASWWGTETAEENHARTQRFLADVDAGDA